MREFDFQSRIIEAERDVLRAMCLGTAERVVWAEGVEILTNYSFRETVHQLVFDTLREIGDGDPRTIREQLPARLNNKGFPDVEMETFFEPHNLTAAQAVALMRDLRSSAPAGTRTNSAPRDPLRATSG